MQFTQPLHRALQHHQDRTATIFGDRRRSFREFADRITRLAGALQGLGMAPGDRVAMLGFNSDHYWEYLVAVPWGGGVVNPCNTRWSAAEIAYALKDSGSRIVLVDDHFVPMARELSSDGCRFDAVIHVGSAPIPDGMIGFEALIAESEPVADAGRRADDLLGLFYTGGTTGVPKGVMLSHTNFMISSLALLAEAAFTRPGIFLHAAPMFHLADLAFAGVHWIAGNTHCFIPGFTPEATANAIRDHRVTDTLLVPTMIQMLVDHPAVRAGHDLTSLRTITYGGSPIAEAVLDRALTALPRVSFLQAYGMTELSPLATVLPPSFHSPEGRGENKLRSAGRAGLCVELQVVNPDGKPVSAGETGEILVRGPNVMLGYWNKPEQTAEALRDGWMHTGDAGFLDQDGFLFVVDRIKDMIITGGENVFSAEVENALAQHKAVRACAVIGIPSERWGESVHAFVVLAPGASVSGDELGEHCKQLIAGYKCPRSFDFVDELPLSGPGKVLKAELRKRYWS
jgi:long-chain acyl-CoA synthetase